MTDPVIHASSEPIQPTVIVNDSGGRSGGGAWFIGIVLVLALVAGIFLFTRAQQGESAKDNAVAAAAGEVGTAAQKVGTAAQSAAEGVAADTDGAQKN